MLAPRHPIEVIARLSSISRLPESLPIQNHVGIAADHQRTTTRNRSNLEPSVLDHLVVGIPPTQLVDAGNDDLELDAQLGEDLPPLRRARG
jgi:hypothetical protein